MRLNSERCISTVRGIFAKIENEDMNFNWKIRIFKKEWTVSTVFTVEMYLFCHTGPSKTFHLKRTSHSLRSCKKIYMNIMFSLPVGLASPEIATGPNSFSINHTTVILVLNTCLIALIKLFLVNASSYIPSWITNWFKT